MNLGTSWEDVAKARSRAPYDPPLPEPMSQVHYQGMVQQGRNPSDYYNPNSPDFSPGSAATFSSSYRAGVVLPPSLIQVDDGSMASAASSSNALNFSMRASGGRFPDRNMFSADSRTIQRDMVALVAGWLSENGFFSTALTLADEAGTAMTNDYHHRKMLRTVAKHVEEGSWDLAYKAIDKCRIQNATVKLGDGCSPEGGKNETDSSKINRRIHHFSCVDRGIDFMMGRQQYLEMIESGNTQQANSHFHKRLNKFEDYIGSEHFQTLASLLACKSISGDGARMYPLLFKDWSVVRGRQQIVTELMRQADESLSPYAYVSSLSPKPETGELSTMVSEALSYRLLRNNPCIARSLLDGDILPSKEGFTIPSLLKAASLSGPVALQLPPQRVVCSFDFNSVRPQPDSSLYQYYTSLPYSTLFKGSSDTDGVHFPFVPIDAPQCSRDSQSASNIRLTACAPLLSRSTILLGTRSGELIMLRVPTAPLASKGFSTIGESETLARLGHRVWALDTAVLGPALSGNFCRRDFSEFLHGEGLRPANGGVPEVFVGAVSGNVVTIISLANKKVIRSFTNDGSSSRGNRMIAHTHRQRMSATYSGSIASTRIEHDALRDLLSIALFSPNASNASHSSTASSLMTNWEREEFRKGQPDTSNRETSSVVVDQCTGQQLIAAVGSEGGELIVFDVFNESHHYRVRAGASSIVTIEFSTSGNSLYAGYRDGCVRVIDTACGVVVRQFDPSLSITQNAFDSSQLQVEVRSAATSSNGTLLAVSYSSSTIHIFDLLSGLPLPIYLVGQNTSSKQRSSICFGATSRIIVSASDDGFLCIWDLSEALSDVSNNGVREGMTALMPTARIPLRMGSAVGEPSFVSTLGGASCLSGRDHGRLMDAISDVKYDTVHDIFVVTTEDGRVFLAGP